MASPGEQTKDVAGKSGRRTCIVHQLLTPIVVSVVSSVGTALATQRMKGRSSLSIPALPAENAVPDPGFVPFLDPRPAATAVPGPDPRHTCAVVVRNDGDFSEENVAIPSGFHGGTRMAPPLSGPDIASSSRLLTTTVKRLDPIEPSRGYGLGVARLNPGERVPLQIGWDEEMDVSAQARSDEFAGSVFYERSRRLDNGRCRDTRRKTR